MSNFAKVSWNNEEGRYELKIDGVLKAYGQCDDYREHEESARQLIKVAEGKGYTVHFERKKEESK